MTLIEASMEVLKFPPTSVQELMFIYTIAFQLVHCQPSSSKAMSLAWIFCFLFPHLLAFIMNAEAKVSGIIVFGDSSVDAGNNNYIPTIARSNFEPYGRDFAGGKPTGRFSNGKITTDFISQAFGLKPTIPAYLDPSYNISDFSTGVTFASAGSGYDNATSDVLSVIPLWKELENYKDYQKKLKDYLGGDGAKKLIKEALHIMSLGTNDFMENYFTFPGSRSSQFTVQEYENFLVGIARNFVNELYGLGARKISIGGLPPMGCLPLERSANFLGGSGCVERYNSIAQDFNGKLKVLTSKLNKEHHGIKVVFTNPYDILMQMINKPFSFGFQITAAGCCATGMFEMGYACSRSRSYTCTNADRYIFWDAFHPTQKANRIISDYVLKNVLAEFL